MFSSCRHFFVAFFLPALCLLACFGRPAVGQQGTWTATTSSGAYLETALLLTDGSVIFHTYGTYTTWLKLTPDAHGDYANGIWTQIASNAVGRLYGQTAVLRDGRVFYGGGEFLQGTTDHNSCEIYDPLADLWTAGPDSLYDALGDTGAAILADGRVLCSNWTNSNTDIYDPVSNSWTNAAPMTNDTGDEETWNTLSDGSVLSIYNIGQRYIPSQNVWLPTGALPAPLVNSGGEIGPGAQLYDGRVFVLGATGHTAFYTPPQTLTGSGSWAAGPDMPNGLEAADTPACVEVNGKVLCLGSPTDYASATILEFDPVTNSFSTVSLPSGLNSINFSARMLALPSGQVLLTANSLNAWIYTPVGGPQAAWEPTVSSVVTNGGIYTVSGTQLNGLTNGSSYGDEANPYTHYPIVYLADGVGNVRFARTSNFSQMSPSTPGGHQTADFTLPADVQGTYNLYVSASGVSSAAFPVRIGPNASVTPTNLSATSSYSKIVLNWTIRGGVGATYSVYRGTTPGGESATALATGVTTNTYTDSAVTNGTTYYYKVVMVVSTSVSGLSNEASATVTAGPPILYVPSTAYPTIQSAINAARTGYVVQVANGTYTGPGNVDLDFGGKNITVQSQHGPASTILECGGSGTVAHRGFLFHSAETSAAVVSGFTIQHANGTDEGACRVEGGSAPTIQNCIFLNNTSNGSGAGMFVNGTATVTNCTFTGNVASGGYQSGGGIFSNGNLVLQNCTFTGNRADNYGAALDINDGAAVGTNCVFSGNRASDAATVLNFGTLTLTNCTSTQNTSGSRAVYNGGTETLTNDILFNDAGGEANGNAAAITYCDIQGGYAGSGNINADPLFLGAPANLHLQSVSPCLAAGTARGAPATDLDGNTRPNPPSIGAYELASGSASGHTHVLWTNVSGQVSLWTYDIASNAYTYLNYGPFSGWTAKAIADGADGKTRLLWTKQDGTMTLWNVDMTNGTYINFQFGPFPGWTATGLSVGADNTTHVLWTNTNGIASIWNYTASSGTYSYTNYGPFPGWTAKSIADGSDGKMRAAWVNTSGVTSLWSLDNTLGVYTNHEFGPFSGWSSNALSVGSDNTTHVLWGSTDGTASFWNYDLVAVTYGYLNYGPYSGWTAKSIADGLDGKTRILWTTGSGMMSLWGLNSASGAYTHQEYGPFSGWTAVGISAGS